MRTILEAVSQIIEERWGKHERATKLNELGSQLHKEFDLEAEMRGAKLLPFLRFRASELIDLVQKPGDELVWGAVPKGKLDISDVAAMEKAFQATHSDRQPRIDTSALNFDRTIWAAFSKPLAVNAKRALKITKPFQFIDYQMDGDIPDGYLDISGKTKHLLGIDRSIADASIVKLAITEWAEGANLEISDFTYIKERDFKNKSVLISLIDRLDNDELKRVSMPLDLVKKLL